MSAKAINTPWRLLRLICIALEDRPEDFDLQRGILIDRQTGIECLVTFFRVRLLKPKVIRFDWAEQMLIRDTVEDWKKRLAVDKRTNDDVSYVIRLLEGADEGD